MSALLLNPVDNLLPNNSSDVTRVEDEIEPTVEIDREPMEQELALQQVGDSPAMPHGNGESQGLLFLVLYP